MRSLSLALVLLIAAPAALAGWGADLDPAQGRRMLQDVEKDLLWMVEAPDDERPDRIARFAEKSARGAIEALKRSRDPALLPLFVTLLDHDDWRVVHRALLVLEHYWDPSAFPRAWMLLEHPERRVREKAAIACIKLWDGSRAPEAIDALLAEEEDLHVRRCLEALRRRAEGGLPTVRVHREVVEKQENGLLRVPFVGDDDAHAVSASGLEPFSKTGRSGKRLEEADVWTGPLLGYGEAAVVGGPMEPFGSLTPDGARLHVGQDLGACLDGAGIYAPAAGIVRHIESGFEGGTVIALEHALDRHDRVTTVLLHGGDTVFVDVGDRVAPAQLLTTVGLSWSPENGGHVAHVHVGIHEGSYVPPTGFDGDVPAGEGPGGWMDPEAFLPSWIERTRPLVAVRHRLDPAFEAAQRAIDRGDIGNAYDRARRVLKEASDLAVREEGEWLLGRLETAPQTLVERARAWLRAGFPARALEELEQGKRRLSSLPDASILDEEMRSWRADTELDRALEGEKEVEKLEKRTARARDPSKLRDEWEALDRAYGDTAVAPRIHAHLDE